MNKKPLLLMRWMAVVMFSILISNLGLVPEAEAATVTVVNRDGTGEGFNDPTSFTPVGGNTATTLGQARLNAFRHAASIWAAQLVSTVPIRVDAQMNPLGSGILGSAGPNTVHRDFTNAPVAGTWYVQALANKLAGRDLDTTQSDIRAQFSSTFSFYFGLDGNTPAGQHDFVTVVLHEIGHGLGFLSLVNPSTGSKFLSRDDAYMRWLERHGGSPAGYPAMSNAQRRAAAVSGPLLHFIGPRIQAGAAGLTAGKTGSHVHMFAPNPVQGGSSVSHFARTIKPDQLMEPSLARGQAIHSTGLSRNLLEDLGWMFTGTGGTAPPRILTPAPNSRLAPNTNTNFTGGHTTAGELQHFVYVGTARGQNNILSRNLGTAHTFTVRTPASGIMHVRYWTRFATGGANGWVFTDQQYTIGATGSAAPRIITPAPNSRLAPNTNTNFTGGRASGELQHWVYVGTARGQRNILNRNLGTGTTFTVRTPASGIIHVRYWTRFATGGANGWVFTDQQYTIGATGSAAPPVITPPPGSTLAANTTILFTGGRATGELQHWVYAGRSRGSRSIGQVNLNTGNRFTIRAAAGTLWVRYWTRFAGGWQFTDQQYTLR